MYLKKKQLVLLLIGLLNTFAGLSSEFASSSIFASAPATVECSVTPLLDKWESIEALAPEKYGQQQYLEMTEALCRKKEKIRVVSYNILFNRYDHQLAQENRWQQRLPRLRVLIEEMQPDILGVQELYPSQAEDLLPLLEESYGYFSKTSQEGELNVIFYRKDRFLLQESSIWAMTSTPDIPSMHDLTMVRLKDLQTNKSVAVFNVHLAFGKIEKRHFQAKFVADKIETYASKIPVILMGDMNMFPQRLDLGKMPFYDGDYLHRILTGGSLKEAREVSLLGHLGPLATFNNFTGTGIPGVLLDRMYVSKGVKVLFHAVQPAKVEGHYPSDHMPLIVECLLE